MHDYAYGKVNLSNVGQLLITLKTFIARCTNDRIQVCFQFDLIQQNKKPDFFIPRHETFAQ